MTFDISECRRDRLPAGLFNDFTVNAVHWSPIDASRCYSIHGGRLLVVWSLHDSRGTVPIGVYALDSTNERLATASVLWTMSESDDESANKLSFLVNFLLIT
jgi:hypothetical protein